MIQAQVAQEALSTLQTRRKSKPPDDYCATYSRHVENTLRKFNPRILVKGVSRINAILSELELEQLETDSNVFII